MYREERTPGWFWLICLPTAGLICSLWVPYLAEQVQGAGDAGVPVRIGLVTGMVATLVLLGVCTSVYRYHVVVEPGRLAFGYARWSVEFPMPEIVQAKAAEISWFRWGGLGWRVRGLRRIGYITHSGCGVEITTRGSGRSYTFNCEEPERVLALLEDQGVAVLRTS